MATLAIKELLPIIGEFATKVEEWIKKHRWNTALWELFYLKKLGMKIFEK